MLLFMGIDRGRVDLSEKMMDFLTPSDFDHFHRAECTHSGSDSNQVCMESMVIG